MSDTTEQNESTKKTKLSTKRGKASSAEKQATTRHGFEPDPAAQPVAGAHGKQGESLERGWDPTRQPVSPDGALLDTEVAADDENDENDEER